MTLKLLQKYTKKLFGKFAFEKKTNILQPEMNFWRRNFQEDYGAKFSMISAVVWAFLSIPDRESYFP